MFFFWFAIKLAHHPRLSICDVQAIAQHLAPSHHFELLHYLRNNKLTDVKGLEKLTKLTALNLDHNQLTDVTDLEKLDQLKSLYFTNNPDHTYAQIYQVQMTLPKSKTYSNPKK